MRLMHVLLTAVNIIRCVRACVRAGVCALLSTHTQAHLRAQCRTHRAHLTVVTHARRARHSMNQNKPVPRRERDKETKRKDREKHGREDRRVEDGERCTDNKPASTCINTFKSNHDIGLHRRNDACTRTIVSLLFSLSFSRFSLWPASRQIVNTSHGTKARITNS